MQHRQVTSRWQLLLLMLLAGVLLTGCPSDAPVAPGEEFASETPFASDPTRSGEAIIQGSVTLQGATTTDTAAYAAPFIATLPGKSGEIALVALGTDQLDTPGFGNRVLYTLKAGTSTLLSKAYVADSTPDHQPIMLLTNDPLKLTLYNSELANSTLHSKRMRWQGSIQTVRKEDIDEPNDDENQATRTDRTLGAALAESTPIDRSFYRRTAVTAEDIEDWYTINVNAGQAYVVDFTNQNGVWSTFTFVLRVVDGAGNTVAFFSNHKTAGLRQLSFVPTTTGTYYLQVHGSPSTRKGSSVYYAPYQLQYRPVAAPQVTAVSLQDVVIAVGTSLPVSATVEGEVTSYNWDLGHGFRPTSDTRASFTDIPVEPGVHQGSLTVSGPWGTSVPYNFSYQIMPTSPWWKDDLLAPVSGGLSVTRPFLVFDLPENRCGLLTAEVTNSIRGYRFHYSGPNGDLHNWTSYKIEPAEEDFNPGPLTSTYVLGNLAFANLRGLYYRAQKPLPLSGADWYIATLPETVDSSYLSIHNIGSRPAIAYCNGGVGPLYWMAASTANPTPADWTEYVLDSTEVAGYGLAGIRHLNRPALVYFTGLGHSSSLTHSPVLKYARARVGAPASASDWDIYTISEDGTGVRQTSFAYTLERNLVATSTGLAVVGGSRNGLHIAWSHVPEPLGPTDWSESETDLDLPFLPVIESRAAMVLDDQLFLTVGVGGSTGYSLVLSCGPDFPWTAATIPSWSGLDQQLPLATAPILARWTARPEKFIVPASQTSGSSHVYLWRPVQ